ncbi:phosphoribosyl-ATP diphosphatase [Sneathiella chinensis]|uniref:Phosphoribosyl-ATP pyrophosphatase n=1 Tax=Sneathiella chinensis TaxID=349750 RepID=A0ABQ5TZE4_9PROT|nr:phosphoribosyl-ATP diphosphatase [Sneathiella chinensis]GLQ05254.1 hypothetical protein GCM10007924_04750 [Sneathiella chinensis]
MSNSPEVLEALFQTIRDRKGANPETSYTASLYAKGTKKIAQKVGEEGVELALAAVQGDRDEIVSESADLFYHMFVLWADAGVEPSEIYAKLAEREGLSGLTEKASRNKG